MSLFAHIKKSPWFLPLMAVLVVGVVVASAVVVSNTVSHTTRVNPPALVLGPISSLDGTSYPGGDRPDLVAGDAVAGVTYDFSSRMNTTAALEGVLINITVKKSGGTAYPSDVVLQYCDYQGSMFPSAWTWRDVVLGSAGSNLVGVCPPGWGTDLSTDDNLLNAFRVTYTVPGDFTFFLTASSGNVVEMNLLQTIQARGSIIVGTQVPYPPWEQINVTTDKLEGIDIEIMEYVAAKLGVSITWQTMDFDPLFAAVQTGQIDCSISAITITAARDEVNDFTSPYYVANQAVLVRDDSNISTIEDLNGSDLVTQMGSTGQWWVEENLSPGSNTPIADVPAAVLGVNNGMWDAFIVDTLVADKYAIDTNYDLKVAFVIYTLESYGILIPQNEPELKAAMDSAIDDMISDGTLDAIMIKWLA